MLDLATRIDRRVRYLDRALPAPSPSNRARLSPQERAELICSQLPALASRCCQEILRLTLSTYEFVCAAPSVFDPGQSLTARERLLRILELVNIAKWRLLASKGEAVPVQEPHVYIFVGNQVYLQDAKGDRELQVDANEVIGPKQT